MDRPLIPRQRIPVLRAGSYIYSAQIKGLPLGYLPVEIDRLPIRTKELMPRYFILHRPFVHQPRLPAAHPDRPDPVHLLPRPFMTEHQQIGIGRRELYMAQPRILFMDHLELPAP